MHGCAINLARDAFASLISTVIVRTSKYNL